MNGATEQANTTEKEGISLNRKFACFYCLLISGVRVWPRARMHVYIYIFAFSEKQAPLFLQLYVVRVVYYIIYIYFYIIANAKACRLVSYACIFKLAFMIKVVPTYRYRGAAYVGSLPAAIKHLAFDICRRGTPARGHTGMAVTFF